MNILIWIGGVILTAIIIAFTQRWVRDGMWDALLERRGTLPFFRRLPRSVRRFLPFPNPLEDYFDLKGHGKMKYVIYPLGLRPEIPLVDLLYLEYLHKLLQDDLVNEVLIFPLPDLSAPMQDEEAFIKFERNARKVFSSYQDKVQVLNLFSGEMKLEVDVFDLNFLKMFEYVGSEDFISSARDFLDVKIRDFSDFSSHHPKNKRLLSIFVHLLNGWLIREYLLRNRMLSGHEIKIGLLFWEKEIGKYGVFLQLQEELDVIIIPIAGRTIADRYEEPEPVFDHERALCFFGVRHEFMQKLVKRGDYQLRNYWGPLQILKSILCDNYQFVINRGEAIKNGKNLYWSQEAPFFKSHDKLILDLSKDQYHIYALYNELWDRYHE